MSPSLIGALGVVVLFALLLLRVPVWIALVLVGFFGNVLVNGNGRTLYVLATEKGKVTCTDTGGCTKIWPPAVLPSGTAHGIAGTGVQASLLGTITSPSGDVRLTYGGWPLYTFVGDSRSGQATGQGVKDAFGAALRLLRNP